MGLERRERRKVDEERPEIEILFLGQCLRADPPGGTARRRRSRVLGSSALLMVMTPCFGCELCRRSLAAYSSVTRCSFITPLGGKTTNWRAGCGKSACPVRREGELMLSLPLSALGAFK